jgi:DNA (cytosine-5)-methyltransferase 1
MKYGSVCSGVEAATVAWHHMGWKPSFYSDIEDFPCAVLKHHYPDVPLHGDFTTIGENDYEPINLLVGGTPCQSFSIAGLRKGMADERGNLALEFLKLAQRTRPKWLVWENVPGVLSSNGGRDFGSFLGGLGELGYGFAYRVLNAVHYGTPMRRRRVYVVGHLGGWTSATAVLFEKESITGIVKKIPVGTLFCLDTGIASYDRSAKDNILIDKECGSARLVTPLEAERAMGFPDNYTRIPYKGKPVEECPDLLRYKAMGNSMAVPVMKWIGERIQGVENIIEANKKG